LIAKARLNRLFGKDGRCFDVAIDHGFFGEASFLKGIEDMRRAVATVVEAGPDAVQLSPGQAPLLQSMPGKGKPSLVLRTDVANVYGKELPRYLFSRVIDDPLGQAIQLDAACVVANVFMAPDQPELHQACVENVMRLKPGCEWYGMPLMIEPLVMKPGGAGGYSVDGDPEKIVPLVRQAVELGADVIKADPTDDTADYGRVIGAAGEVPVLVRGGGKASDEEILRRTHELMGQGARGIVYGRNVIQHDNPRAMTEALMRVVHDGATPEEALEALEEAGTRA
jgi:DhnA family fructose-bisphosphate aldolase class Ia